MAGSTTTTTRYAVDGWNPAKMDATGTANFDVWAVFNASGSLITRQLQGDGIDQHLAYVTGGGTAYWYLKDHLGSTRSVADNSATVQDALAYDAYGNITSQTADPSTVPLYTYTGRQLDVETDLQYNRARWYGPATGRWMTQDPMGFNAGDSNLYRYVSNKPTSLVDPEGTWEWPWSSNADRWWWLPGPGEADRWDSVKGGPSIRQSLRDEIGSDLPLTLRLNDRFGAGGTIVRKNDNPNIVPTRDGFQPANPNGRTSLGQHALDEGRADSPYISGSTLKGGAKNIQGEPYWIDINGATGSGVTIHGRNEIARDLQRMNTEAGGAYTSRIENWRALQRGTENEVLLKGSIPPGAIRGRTLMKITKAGKLYGEVMTAIELGDAAVQSYKKEDPEIVTKESARQIGGWVAGLAGAKAGAVIGAACGIESGPGLFATGLIGSAIGFWVGYYGTGAALGDYSPLQ